MRADLFIGNIIFHRQLISGPYTLFMQIFSRTFGPKTTAFIILFVVTGAGISLAGISKLNQMEAEIQGQREEIIRISRERLEESRQARADRQEGAEEILNQSFFAETFPIPQPKSEKEIIENNEAPALPVIISQWRPRIASLTCAWEQDGETLLTKSGSGVSFGSGENKILIYTNNHVIWEEDFDQASQCSARFPGLGEEFTAAAIISRDVDPDLGLVELEVPPAVVVQIEANKVNPTCSNSVEIGDMVIVLGYPTIGAEGDITVTEGIISGREGSYFVTSAKVDEGNSGGAAILVKDNCYLGIPTYVKRGGFESLARILDRNSVSEWFNSLAE